MANAQQYIAEVMKFKQPLLWFTFLFE